MKKPAVISIKNSSPAPAPAAQAEKQCCNHDCRQGRDCPLRPTMVRPFALGAKGAILRIVAGLSAAAVGLFCMWR